MSQIVRVTIPQGNGSSSDTRVSGAGIYAADFGAVGDNTSNDTTALQNALNAVPSGGTLHLTQNKMYLITSALTGLSNKTLDLHGSVIRQNTTTANGLTGVDVVNFTVRDGEIRGPYTGTGTGKGISITRSARSDTWRVVMDRVLVSGWGGDGVDISNPITSRFATVEARDNVGHGFNIHGVSGGSAGTSCSFDACYANGNLQAGFHVGTMAYCSFTGCAADSNGIAYDLVNAQGFTFSGCGAESQVNRSTGYPGHAWKLTGGIGVVLDGCWTYDSPARSVWLTGTALNVVISGFMENTPQVGATNSLVIDAGSQATVIHFNNTKPMTLTGQVLLVNDAGGMSVPGYGYFGGTFYAEGKITTGSPIGLKTTTTGARPTAASAGAGAAMYDTTLGVPIFSNGTNWRNAAGTTV